ncbi:MAG: hypothetical protein H6737_30620 [Alphaproteobacteria bacterium]|nr:hypothetical protein [Alphaproteobacteria bacterium]
MILALAIAAASEPADLEGTWGLRIEVVTANDVPVVGSLQSTSHTWVQARIRRDGDGWVQEHRVCDSAVTGGLVKSRVPPAYTRAVPVKTYTVALASDGDALTYRADLGRFGAGWDLACAYVPAEAGDPCEVDFESDGKPGATVEVKVPMFAWGEVYVAQMNHLVLTGRTVSSDRVDGSIDVRELETHVLGASRSMFHRDPKSDVVPGASRFSMVRLADDAGCDAVMALPD